MKTYRQREKQGNKVQESTKGPDESKIKVNSHFTGRFWEFILGSAAVMLLF